MEKLLPKTETKYLSTQFSFFNKKRKPETDVCISEHSLFKKFTSSHFSHIEMSTRGYRKNIISTAINLFESPWWPLTKGHLVLHDNMRPAFLFVRIAVFHDA